MNAKAQSFKTYLEEKKIEVFSVEELSDEQETTLFRSFITVNGQQLPLLLILDNSIFALIRVQVSPKVMADENRLAVLGLANAENEKYKPFKLYADKAGDLLLDVSVVVTEEKVDGDVIYRLFGVIIDYLEGEYRNIMKEIW